HNVDDTSVEVRSLVREWIAVPACRLALTRRCNSAVGAELKRSGGIWPHAIVFVSCPPTPVAIVVQLVPRSLEIAMSAGSCPRHETFNTSLLHRRSPPLGEMI